MSKIMNYISECFALDQTEKKTVFKVIRLAIYLVTLILFVLGMWAIAIHYQKETFREYSIIENLQLIALFASGILFLCGAIKNNAFRPLFVLLSGLIAFCCIRESDNFFENLIPVIGWKFAWLFPLAGMWYMFKNRKTVRKPLFDFLNSNAFHLMVTALILFIPVAQCLGHKPFIVNSIGTTRNLIVIRRMIEESVELLAYILIFLSAIEMHFEFSNKKKR